jgi:XTP/dITP diphosphohydrolase
MKIYFVTTSSFKTKELETVLCGFDDRLATSIDLFSCDLPELLDCDIDHIVTFKALAAFEALSLPCVVEHSGLFMDALPGLPGGLGQVIWHAIGDRMCGFLRDGDSRAATARSVVGYCDGRRVHLYRGETRGRIAERARGSYACNWDPIFIPDGSDQTYGEMGLEKKLGTSPNAKAWQQFLSSIVPSDHAGHR